MKWLLVDASPIIYQAYNTVGHFSNSAGEKTGVRYGFLRTVRSVKRTTKADQVLICFDNPGPVLKAADSKEYKANRKWSEDKDKMYAQVPGLKEMISLTSWSWNSCEGYEADDLIGQATEDLTRDPEIEVVICTPDNDMVQLVNDRVKVYVPGKHKRYKDVAWCVEEYGVPPAHLLWYRAAVGDKSDNLDGVGLNRSERASFREFLRETTGPFFGASDVAEEYDAAHITNLWTSSRLAKFIQNVKVMRLANPPLEEITYCPGERDAEGLTKLFERLEFKSMLRHVKELTS